MSWSVFRHLAAALVPALASVSLAAQCDLSWLPGAPAGGPKGRVFALLPAPGGGLIAGGDFPIADRAVVNNIARWDGTTWRALGEGINGIVRCLTRLPNGHIVAGGSFTSAGGQPASNIAVWDGIGWTPLGTGLNGLVRAMLVMPNGDLIAGGVFAAAAGLPAARVARWNGIAWTVLGAGFTSGQVQALGLAPNGRLLAGGSMGTSSGMQGPIAQWDGTSWTFVPGFGTFSIVSSIVRRANGEVICAGDFFLPSPSANLVRWNGTSVQPLASPLSGSIGALLVAANGDLVAGSKEAVAPTVARWNGANWTAIPDSPTRIAALAEDVGGSLVVGSTPANYEPTRAVHRYNGIGWQLLGAPLPPQVTAMVRLPDGDVVVGGAFTTFAGVAANNLARWDGSGWSPLGLGVDGPVVSLAAAPDGDLIVGGMFAAAGGAPATNIARWDGQTWSTLGPGVRMPPRHLAVARNGDVFCSPGNELLRFDSVSWSTVSVPATVASYQSLAALPNGDVSLGGVFVSVPGQPVVIGLMLYRNGSVVPFPGAPGVVTFRQLATADGGLVVRANGLWRWDGTTWSQLPSIVATGLDELPNGELVAGASYGSLGGGAPSALYRLRNGAWESFGEVFGSGTVVTVGGRGDLLVAGAILSARGQVSVGFAHAAPTCRAAVTAFGAGCSGGAGPVTLRADNLPWAGGIYRATATGMPSGSVAVQAFGVTPALQPLPGGAPGCSLFVVPVVVDLVMPAAGVAVTAFPLPNSPSLFGRQLRQQVIGIELSPAGIVQLTSTNALDLTIGGL